MCHCDKSVQEAETKSSLASKFSVSENGRTKTDSTKLKFDVLCSNGVTFFTVV
jgi:hypothetical protein